MPAIVLEEIGPFRGDTPETVEYRRCDFCDRTATDDIYVGKLDEDQWRRFYLLPDGMCCCEHCVSSVEE